MLTDSDLAVEYTPRHWLSFTHAHKNTPRPVHKNTHQSDLMLKLLPPSEFKLKMLPLCADRDSIKQTCSHFFVFFHSYAFIAALGLAVLLRDCPSNIAGFEYHSAVSAHEISQFALEPSEEIQDYKPQTDSHDRSNSGIDLRILQ